MRAEQADGVSIRLPASGDHPYNFGLLLMSQLWRSLANMPFPASDLQTSLRAFPQHRAFELANDPTTCIMRPAGMVV